MTRRHNSHSVFGPALLSILLGACGVGPDEGTEENTSPIVNGTTTGDSIGNVFISSGCSGTLLSPQWVLAAGHCIQQRSPIAQSWTSVSVYLGKSTTNPVTATEFHIHPNWWHPGLTAATGPSLTNWNAAFDVALIHLPTPLSSAGYSNGLFNQISNRAAAAGQTVRCFGYGGTTVPNMGGGLGDLQTALLPVSNITTIGNGYPTGTAMIEVTPNTSQQIIYFGDSGGGCSVQAPFSEPNVIGVNESADYLPGQAPTEAWLVQTSVVHGWIDQTMHGAKQSLGLPPGGTPTWISSLSSPSYNGNAIYVIAGYRTKAYMRAYSDASGWSAWSTISIPSVGINSRVAMSATSFSPGYVQLVLAVLGTDQKMYVAPLIPGTGPSASWTSIPWAASPAGVFLTGSQPAIGYIGSRVDVFGIGTDSKIWTNWKTDITSNNWISGWVQVPTPMTFAKGVSVAYSQGSYYLVGLSDDTAQNPNTGNSPWILTLSGVTGSNQGTWSGPTSLGGNFLSPPAITAWIGGLVMYGIGTDSNLWRASYNLTDPIFIWGGWFNVSTGPFKQPEGMSVNTSYASAGQIDIVTADTTSTPMLIKYPL